MPESQERLNKLNSLLVSIVVITIASLSLLYVALDYKSIAKKDLYSYDESTNSVVSANHSRQLFPSKLRLNSYNNEYTNWTDGPGWQHIPSAFTYVALPAFLLFGIDVVPYRLSFILLALLSFIFFSLKILKLQRNHLGLVGISIVLSVVIFWSTPFVRCLFHGACFGFSDVLLMSVNLMAFVYIYKSLVNQELKEINRFRNISFFYAFLALFVKNALGLIPLGILALLDLYNYSKDKNTSLVPYLLGIAFIGIQQISLYLIDPSAFLQESLIALKHFGDYENWGRPWHFHITKYLLVDYLHGYLLPYLVGLGLTIYFFKKFDKEAKILILLLCSFWFTNLIVLCFVQSKSPNFIFQTYYLGILLSMIGYITLIQKILMNYKESIRFFIDARIQTIKFFSLMLLLLSFIVLTISMIKEDRVPKNKNTHEKFYAFGRALNNIECNRRDIFILDVDNLPFEGSQLDPNSDFWFRYYILFHCGSESRTIEEINLKSKEEAMSILKNQYDRVFLVLRENDQRKSDLSLTIENNSFGACLLSKEEWLPIFNL